MNARHQLLLIMLMTITAIASAQPAWHTVKKPTEGKTKIYGGYANGCFAGGITIPIDGHGYQQVRPSRNRNYGDQSLSLFIQYLGKFAKSQNATVILGDLSQPRGGAMNFGHSSHQIGLDVDIWFELVDESGLTAQQREKLQTPSLVDAKKAQIIHWQPYYRELLYQSAIYPKTERIFVNPVIKSYLCETEKDKSWLYKLRPWFGHDSHFHVRLACPKEQRECISQPPVQKVTGCDADLQNWINDQRDYALGIKKHKASIMAPKKVMPVACQQVLAI